MKTEQRLINLDYLEKFTKGDNEKIRKYISMYLKNTPEVIRDFQNEYNKQNYENLRLKAHSIKPQAKYFGIATLENILIEIETIILNGDNPDKLQSLISTANQLNDKIATELVQHVDSLTA